MATSWKSQQGNGEYSLQFETDNKEKYKLVEKAAQMAVDGKTIADVVEVVRCKDCKHFGKDMGYGKHDCQKYEMPYCLENDYCSYGERKGGAV